ncbi:unnamed protein product [Cylindrotheca closterium]|uniref:Oxidation resistance protein 1 n=1 Tax=Cylindrotheca closterium TaxID=2856 RepID=A0AAD2CCI1_9STRA|nr:unnamed protein product [Cylindrotheca closterium]
MGLTSSAPAELSKKQKDIAYLGNRLPFGDDELVQLYNAYHLRKTLASRNEHTSFLVDIGILCYSKMEPGEAELKERKLLIQALESKILPPSFGNRLFQTSFIGPQDLSDYNDDKPTSSVSNATGEEDEFTHRANLEAFFSGAALCGRRGAAKTLQVLVEACEQHPAPPSENGSVSSPFEATTSTRESTLIDPVELISMGYRVALASAFLSATTRNDDQEDVGRFLPDDKVSDHPGLVSLATSLKAFATKRKQRLEHAAIPPSELLSLVSAEDVAEWGEQMAPMFAASLSSLMHQLFFPHKPPPPTRTSFEFPQLSDESIFFNGSASPLLFSFACMSPSLSGEYYRLYTSLSDGLSFNRLQNSLLGYGGPTLLIIRATDNTIFGAYTASSWKESKDFYGNTDCFLFQLSPSISIYHPSGNSQNFMYCNSYARSRGYDQQAHGIGFGGSVQEPRLFIAESFDDCVASDADLTFAKGRLLGNANDALLGKSAIVGEKNAKYFDIDSLEVWGVGGTEVVMEALGARTKHRDIRQAGINKARKVDKAAFLEDFQSGLMDSKAFAHRNQIQGRDGACVGVDDLNKYEKEQSRKRSGS